MEVSKSTSQLYLSKCPAHKRCVARVYSMSLTTMCLSDMEFLEVLMEGLDRVLLVRGGGREVITIYS